jgi:hypothetical protein
MAELHGICLRDTSVERSYRNGVRTSRTQAVAALAIAGHFEADTGPVYRCEKTEVSRRRRSRPERRQDMAKRIFLGCGLGIPLAVGGFLLLLSSASREFKPLVVGILHLYNETGHDIYEESSNQLKARMTEDVLPSGFGGDSEFDWVNSKRPDGCQRGQVADVQL